MNGSNYRNQLLNWVDQSITDHNGSISCLSLVMCHCDLTDLNAFTLNNKNAPRFPHSGFYSGFNQIRAKPATF